MEQYLSSLPREVSEKYTSFSADYFVQMNTTQMYVPI